MVVNYYLTAAASFLVTVALIIGFRPLARSVGLVDVPSARKDHLGEIPLVGGLSIFCALFIVHFIGSIAFGGDDFSSEHLYLYGAGFMLLVIGIIDDYMELSAITRIIAEVVACLVMIYGAGILVLDLGTLTFDGGILTLGLGAVPFTVVATVGLINAINMADGLDGLAGSITLIPILGFIAASAMFGSGQDLGFLIMLVGAIVGFLAFNMRFPNSRRALIFLGDSGAMFLGFVLAWFAISFSQGDSRVISPASALWFFALPVYDAVCMTSRRIIRGRTPFIADKEHLHHVFLLAGFRVTETVAIIAGLAAFGVIVGLLGTSLQISDRVLAGSFVIVGLLYFWIILRSWTVMRFLRRSICRRREIADRRTQGERRRRAIRAYEGAERRSGVDRRRGDRRRSEHSS